MTIQLPRPDLVALETQADLITLLSGPGPVSTLDIVNMVYQAIERCTIQTVVVATALPNPTPEVKP